MQCLPSTSTSRSRASGSKHRSKSRKRSRVKAGVTDPSPGRRRGDSLALMGLIKDAKVNAVA